MYNLVHYFIGFLAELGFITPEGAQAIDRELSPQIISSNAEEAFKQVHDAMEKVAKDLNIRGDLVKIEPWLTHLNLLEKRVKKLEDSLVKDSKPVVSALTGKARINKKPIAKAKS